MNKQEIFNLIQELIKDEKGDPITLDSKLSEANLDSLGTLMFIANLNHKVPILDEDNKEDSVSKLDLQNITIRELINLCKSSTTNISKGQS